MPFLSEVGIQTFHDPFNLSLYANILFSDNEIELGIIFNVGFILIEVDDRTDVYSILPNNHHIAFQRASRGAEDDGGRILRPRTDKIKAAVQNGPDSFGLTHRVGRPNESDMTSEFRALAFAIPEPSTAMRWSKTFRMGIDGRGDPVD